MNCFLQGTPYCEFRKKQPILIVHYTVDGITLSVSFPRRWILLLRARLSPSPATGLVGLPENGFLDDFFGCLGFLCLASET